MAIDPGIGDTGLFYIDAAAHSGDLGVAARVIALHSGATTCSIVVDSDPPIPYGPIATPYTWTANPSEVSLTASGLGYYFILTEAVRALDAANTATAAATAGALAVAQNNNTPVALLTNRGSWTYDATLEYWHQRFPVERHFFYVQCPLLISSYRFLIKDVVGGPFGVNVYEQLVSIPPTAPFYAPIGTSPSTAANGTVQELIVPLSPTASPAVHRVEIISGGVLGGPLIADQYHLYQFRAVV